MVSPANFCKFACTVLVRKDRCPFSRKVLNWKWPEAELSVCPTNSRGREERLETRPKNADDKKGQEKQSRNLLSKNISFWRFYGGPHEGNFVSIIAPFFCHFGRETKHDTTTLVFVHDEKQKSVAKLLSFPSPFVSPCFLWEKENEKS